MWFDKSADRLDNHGMIDGIVDSNLFSLVLTTDYFKRRYCVFEYCIAIVAERPVITVAESDPRYGGGPLGSFNLHRLFKHILDHEVIEIHRTYWEGFISKLHTRIEKTIKSNAISRIVRQNSLQNPILKEQEIELLVSELSEEGRTIGVRLFDSSEDGDTAREFHEKCDDRGPTLTVIETSDGNVFGGFTPISWSSTGRYMSAESWLFKRPYVRIDIKPNMKRYAVFHSVKYGPAFGCDIVIGPDYSYCEQNSYSSGILSDKKERITFKVKRFQVFEVLDPESTEK